MKIFLNFPKKKYFLQGIPQSDLEVFLKLETITSPDENWSAYRKYIVDLKWGSEPAIPYIGKKFFFFFFYLFPGLILKDLTFLEEMGPTQFPNSEVFNFQKLNSASKHLSLLVKSQSCPYSHSLNWEICNLFFSRQNRLILDDEKMYSQSKFLEPVAGKKKDFI